MSRTFTRQEPEGELMKVFSKNFKRLISESGMTQLEAAARLKLTPSSVTDYIYGRIAPEWGTMDRICAYFQITPGELFASDNREKVQKMIWMTRSYLEQLEKISGSVKP